MLVKDEIMAVIGHAQWAGLTEVCAVDLVALHMDPHDACRAMPLKLTEAARDTRRVI